TVSGCPTSSVPECSSVTLTANATGSPCYFYQWCRNGVAIPGATLATYTTPALRCPADQNVMYQVKVANHFSQATSAVCTVQIACDVTAPTLVSDGSLDGKCIGICFSECVTPETAGVPANYTVTDAAGTHTVTSATVRPDGKTVIIC